MKMVKYCVVLSHSMILFSVLAGQRGARGFSFNTAARTIFYPKEELNDHSYFGYSILLRKGPRPMIIVGAPRDTSAVPQHSTITDPGGIYKCPISFSMGNHSCHQLVFDTDGNTINPMANSRSYIHHKDNMWLGMTVDGVASNNGPLVVCAPRWVNQYFKNYRLANGLCYGLKNDEFDNHSNTTLLPLVEHHSQWYTPKLEDGEQENIPYHAYGQAGFSMKVTEDGAEVIMGAPGVYGWTGSVAKYNIGPKRYMQNEFFTKNIVPNPYFSTQIQYMSYFGYSVDSGKFIVEQSNLYVVGAPRGADYKGQVFLVDFPLQENAPYFIFAMLEGHQLGEYFGSTVLAVDIDQDGLSDLLVGAPMYAQKFSSDQGRVYVYMNKDKANLVEQEVPVSGSLQSGARFGTSISAIGDINEDGFTDIAIGAPYENDGKGAVYIYLGTANGLSLNYTQRIVMDDMRGFGISISRGVDIDMNSCNDVAIGAHESARAVLLRCHNSVDVSSTLSTFPSELSLESTNFTARVCHTFIGTTDFRTVIKVNLSIDSKYKRAYFNNTSDETYVINGSNGKRYCKIIIVNINTNNKDFSSPINIQVGLQLLNDPLKDPVFCKDCTVLRPSTKQISVFRVPFATGCGEDLVCQPDLRLRVDILTDLPYVIGSSTKIGLNISVENMGEPAFLTRTEFIPPASAPLLRMPHRCDLLDSMLSCDFANPLTENSPGFVFVELDTSLLTSVHSALDFNVSVTSMGEEVNPSDNVFSVKLPLQTVAKVLVIGEAVSDAFVFIKNRQNITIQHKYEIINEGPTPLHDFQIEFFIPVAYKDDVTNIDYPLVEVFEPQNTPFLCRAVNGRFFIGKEGHSIDIGTEIDGAQSYGRTNQHSTIDAFSQLEESSRDNPDKRFLSGLSEKGDKMHLPPVTSEDSHESRVNLHLNCSDLLHVTCLMVHCTKPGGLPSSGNGAYMTLRQKLNVTNFEKLLQTRHSLTFSTYAFAMDTTQAFGYARSLISGSPPPAASSIWFIILSVVLGIILLAIITFWLHKCNFFKRKIKEDLELLKSQEDISGTK